MRGINNFKIFLSYLHLCNSYSVRMRRKSSLLQYAQDRKGTALSEGTRTDPRSYMWPFITALTFGLHDKSEGYSVWTTLSSADFRHFQASKLSQVSVQ